MLAQQQHDHCCCCRRRRPQQLRSRLQLQQLRIQHALPRLLPTIIATKRVAAHTRGFYILLQRVLEARCSLDEAFAPVEFAVGIGVAAVVGAKDRVAVVATVLGLACDV